MEKERVLAYQMSKEIDPTKLNDISGGSGMTQFSSHVASGNSGGGWDAQIDYQFDF